jgi:phasin
MEMQMANPETKARAAKAAAADAAAKAANETTSAANDFGRAAFSYPAFEVPELFRSFADQSLSQTRENYQRMKAAAEEATDLLEESLETTRENVRDAQLRALELAKANTDATFELFGKLMTTNSIADAVQVQTAFARERFEALIDYTKDAQATFAKAGTEAAKPVKAMFEKTLSAAKAA